jgi:hypothetical protein
MANKRMITECISSPNKSRRLIKDIWDVVNNTVPVDNARKVTYNHWVSGSEIKNYLMKDTLLDWLNLYYVDRGLNDKKYPTRSAKNKRITELQQEQQKLNILFENGNEFERKVFHNIRTKFPNDCMMIANNGRSDMSRNNFDKTTRAMSNGVPIIMQAVLYNDSNSTCGVADLVIRSDYFNRLFNRQELTRDEESHRAPNCNGNYHYRVVDIKWTTMTLCANGNTIRNEHYFPAYKGQVAIYTAAVGQIQGYTPDKAYIMTKGWKIDKKGSETEGYNCFDLLGTIDYNGFDSQYLQLTSDAINWVRKVRKSGSQWSVLNPTVPELYPNSSNSNDAPWGKIKKFLSNHLEEITQVWYVGVKHRNNAHASGVYKWSDCTTEILDMNEGKRSMVIDQILNVNRDTEHNMYPIDGIVNNNFRWQSKSKVDFYVDFETINECFQSQIRLDNSKTESDVTFMIGVGYEENAEWNYTCFSMTEYGLESERDVMDEFTKFITNKAKELDETAIPRLFHWSQAEPRFFNRTNMRNGFRWNKWEQNIIWVDMYNVFTDEPIVVKGSLCFKLKEIGKAFHKLGYITTLWDDNGPGDGLTAMIDAIQYYKSTERDQDMFNKIIRYNEIDCKVLWEINTYLRNNCVENIA